MYSTIRTRHHAAPRDTETQHNRAVNRSAIATGSISDSAEEYFVPGLDVDAWIARSQ